MGSDPFGTSNTSAITLRSRLIHKSGCGFPTFHGPMLILGSAGGGVLVAGGAGAGTLRGAVAVGGGVGARGGYGFT